MKRKTAIITGGSKGIGLSIAKILAKRNFNIVICSRNIKQLAKAKKNIESLQAKCVVIRADISNYNDCKKVIRETIKKFSSIDLLVNNAGYQGPVGKVWENNISDWKNTIDINLLGTFYMLHEIIPHMLKQKSGLILNLSGGGSVYARPCFSAYGSSKTAVLRLTETLHEELKGKNINVIAIAPGAVWTSMTKSVLTKNSNRLNKKVISELKILKKTGGTLISKIENMIDFLVSGNSKKFSGKLIHVNEIEKLSELNRNIKDESGLLRRVDYKK